jgi:hypothetical protein
VGSNLLVNVYSSNVLAIEGNVNAQKMTLGTITVTSAYGLNHVTAQGSVTGDTISLTNATTGLTADSNIVVGGNVTAETVITSANVEVGDRLKFASNVFVDDLRVADLAANLVTYDKTTGELMDSGGLFANKLAVVSVQPPSALSANTTTIAKHGTYTVTTSSLAANSNAWNAFDGDSAVEWLGSTTSDHVYNGGEYTYSGTSNLFAGNYIQTGASSAGEWLAVEFPYKTTLRHMKLTPPTTYQQYPASANVYATNDSLTWTELTNWSGVNPGDQQSNVQTIIVNATESYKKYAMVVTKTNGSDTNTALAEWKLFTESFSIDGGKVEMATSAVMGGETTMDQHGPHSRDPKAVPLKKYPEIVFEEGKVDKNIADRTYTQAGYTVTVSSQYDSDPEKYYPYEMFNGILDTSGDFWVGLQNYSGSGNYAYTADTSIDTITVNSVDYKGDWVQIKTPYKIQLSSLNIRPQVSAASRSPKKGILVGSTDGTNWEEIYRFTNETYTTNQYTIFSGFTNTNYYNYFRLLAEELQGTAGYFAVGELELYGYEEDPPAGDTSVDTTFTSIMNTPQTTGANVYVDGSLGETFTNRVTGPDATGPSATYDATGKYWELNGSLESNIAVEANTFLEGDAPHSVSVWFNSSNLEANVSNTCVFSISDQEKLDSVNLDLQSNTWHNLTYAYQGEGGSRVTYLDGRKVAEDQAEDTFGEYPPFAMTGNSQGGYVVSASSLRPSHQAWHAFDKTKYAAGVGEKWASEASQGDTFTGGNSLYDGTNRLSSSTPYGAWLKIELPHKIRLQYISLFSDPTTEQPKDFIIYGSNDDNTWDQLFQKTGATENADYVNYTINSVSCYKYFGLVIRRLISSTTIAAIDEWKLYGHRENDLVRLPDPTNVLKYPHIAMTGPAQRGYVASAKNFVAGREPWEAFNGYVYGTHPSTPNDNGWMSNGLEFIKSTGAYYQNGDTFTDTASGTHTGPWIRLETPHKLQLSSFDISNGNNAERRMKSIVILGSDDASVSTGWSLIYTNTNITNAQDVNGLVVNSSQAFKYHMIVTKAVSGAPGQSGSTAVWVAELQLYGTGVDSIPIQIGGGNIDKVANFRVYDKFVGEDQALEIWDAQKDTFRGVKNSVTLHKGRLGIGTTEPEGRLAVLDEPNGLEEFPPRAMTGYKNYFEGHGEFCVYASTELIDANHEAWKSFNKFRGNDGWHTGGVNYTSGVYTAGKSLGGISGDYLVLKLPYKINLKSIAMVPRGGLPQRGPGSGVILGSNDEVIWEQVHSFSGITYTDNVYTTIDAISSTKTYNVFAMVVTNLAGTGVNTDYVNLAEWKLFGTREQGQSVLHDGQLTLTKSLTVPRIGPALDADDTPRRDRLVVEYNTSTNPTFEGAVRDTSGRGLDGVFTTGAGYDAVEKVLTFNGASTSGVSIGGATGVGGDKPFSIGLWFKTNQNPVSTDVLTYIGGNETSRETVTLTFSTTQIKTEFYGQSMGVNPSGGISVGTWYHVVATYPGGGHHNVNIHVNGVKLSQTNYGSSSTALIPENADIFIGKYFNTNNSGFNGSISQFKLYDTTLTAEEVKTLYDMGRCDEGHHVVNFSKTRVGIGLGDGEAPHRDLDVRGRMRVGTGLHNIQPNPTGSTGTGANVPTLEVSDSGGSRANPVPTVLQITNALGGGSDWSLTDPFAKLAFATVDASGPGDGGVVGSIGMTCTAGGGGDDSRLIFATDSGVNHSEKMCITKGGFVGIGTTSPNADLYLKCSADTFTGGGGMTIQTGTGNKYWRMIASDYLTLGRLAFGYSTNNTSWSDSGYLVPASNNQMNFTGQHRTFIKDVPFSQAGDLEGLIVSSDQNKYIKMSGGIEAGSNAITTNESLPVVSLSNVVTDKKCFGVISASEDPEERSDSFGNFVSVAEKEKGDTRVYINSVGEGAIWVSNIGGSLEAGDYITTSNVAGYGQKQNDDVLHNYTVAKITMDCDFEPATQPVQQILRSNVVETYYLGNVHHTKTVPHEFVTTTVTADDAWSNVSISPSDTTYAEWSNLEANTQNTYTLTYTQTSNVVYDTKYTLTTTANVTESDSWDRVFVDPPDVTYAEYSNLEANTQNTYTLTYTQTTTDEKTPDEWSTLESNVQSLYNKVYYQSVEEEVASDYPGAVAHTRVTDVIENELDEHGQIQWEDHPTETEKAYKIRYLDASGAQTDSANAVHIAAFVGCTYHCG